MALKTVLGQVIIWCDKGDQFDPQKITNIKDDQLNLQTVVERITPPVNKFSNGEDTECCNWWKAMVITDKSEKQLSTPELISSRIALNKALESTPEHVSYRWKE